MILSIIVHKLRTIYFNNYHKEEEKKPKNILKNYRNTYNIFPETYQFFKVINILDIICKNYQ